MDISIVGAYGGVEGSGGKLVILVFLRWAGVRSRKKCVLVGNEGEKAKKARSLSPPSDVPRRIGAVTSLAPKAREIPNQIAKIISRGS
jgi:hypothetical protein